MVFPADGGTEDNDVALAALEAFYGVYGKFADVGKVERGEGLPHAGDLCTEGDDDADVARQLSAYSIVKMAQDADDSCRRVGFARIAFLMESAFFRHGGDESDAGVRHECGPRVLSVCHRECFFLVREGNGGQFSSVEFSIDKIADFRVHASLPVEHGHGFFFCALHARKVVEPFEKRVAAVRKSDGLQFGVIHTGVLLGLYDNGGKLFVVSYEDEFANGAARQVIISVMGFRRGAEQGEELWLKHL